MDDGGDKVERRIGTLIRSRRVTLGMTQVNLARDIGVSFQQLQKYETGENRVSASRLLRIARALDVTVAYFFDGLGDDSTSRARPVDPLVPFLSTQLGRQICRTMMNLSDANKRIVIRLAKTLEREE